MLRKTLLALSLLTFLPGCRLFGACLDTEKCKKDDPVESDDETGSGDCSGVAYLGTYTKVGTNSETFTVNSVCTVTGSKCDFSGTVSAVSGNSGTFTLNLTTFVATDCSSLPEYGDYSCTFGKTTSAAGTPTLTLNCVKNGVYLTSGDWQP